MTTTHTIQDPSGERSLESAFATLQQENKLLFTQLHVVQEELERVHHASGGQSRVVNTRVVLEDGRFPEVAAENLRYRAIVDAQQEVSRLERQQSLAGGLGELLIQGTTSVSAFTAMPARLLKVWRKEKQQTPPKALGGKSFSQVLAAYAKGGAQAVDALLAQVSISATTHANALTALARSLMHTEPVSAVEFARRAYAAEPRPFRLKWLAFRLHEAGQVVEAEAMLEVLPQDTRFSDSESRQAHRLRNDAKQVRLREALQSTGYAERRGKVEQQIGKLEQRCEELAEQVAQRKLANAALEVERDRALQETSILLAQRAEQEAVEAELRGLVDALKRDRAQLQQEQQELHALHAEQLELVAERDRALAALQAAKALLEQEKLEAIALHAEQAAMAMERGRTIDALEASSTQVNQEKLALASQLAAQLELLTHREQEAAAIEAAKLQVEQEKSSLLSERDKQLALSAELGGIIEALKAAKAQLKQENAALLVKHVEQFELAAERGRAIEQLKASQATQEAELASLRTQLAEQAKLAHESAPQIKALQEQLQSRQVLESDLSTRQHGMHEELVKAEAQLDLIKDMLFRGARL